MIHFWLLLVNLDIVHFGLAASNNAFDFLVGYNVDSYCPFSTQSLTDLVSNLTVATADVDVGLHHEFLWKYIHQMIDSCLYSLLLPAYNLHF